MKACLQIVERRKGIKSFYFQYQTEAMPKGISIEQFCSRNKVPYNIFYNGTKKVQTECNQACLNCRVAAFLIKGYTQQNIGSEGMTAEEQKRYINYLVERLEQADLGLRARDAVLQDFLDKQKEYDERLSKLDNVLSKVSSLESSLKEKERKLKSAERKVADLSAKLKFAEKNRFGDKSYGSKKKNQP